MSATAPDKSAVDDIQTLSQIFEQRLQKSAADGGEDISIGERTELIAKFGDLLRRLSSLMKMTDEAQEDGTAVSLDTVLERLMGIITDALDAERSTLFLYDRDTDELFSRIAQGELIDEIRVHRAEGIAGWVFSNGEAIIIDDAYADDRFNPEVDRHTGFRTRSILCAPVRNWENRIIGVAEVLNSTEGTFNQEDVAVLEALTGHAAAALESSQLYESVEKALHDEAQLLGVTAALSSELQLDVLLDKIMSITTVVLDADRSTLFLYDHRANELWSQVAEGVDLKEIRIPADAGIAGSVFVTGETVNIPDAYKDDRFNPAVDKATGYKTKSILCMPVVTNEGKTIGVTQVLNKIGGPFGPRDEKRLQALGAQAAIALENARLFEDVLNERNYSESILRSLSNGVITLDAEHRIIKVNQAASRILSVDSSSLENELIEAVVGENRWVLDSLSRVQTSGEQDMTLDADVVLDGGDSVSVNLTIDRLHDVKGEPIGFILIFEDITSEKRVKSTMARYMDRELADRLLEGGDLAGTTQEASVLFSDIRDFTGLAERLGARDTVSMLNDYFSEMVDVVQSHRGMLDKYIGDAIMAVFGTPFPGDNDADNAVAAAVEMIAKLRQFNRERTLQGLPPIDIRVGVNTGEVVAGNIGSPKRVDYTVIGDSVNLASRLESANKFYGTNIMISESSLRALKTVDQPVRELDWIQVKGRDEPVAVYEIYEEQEDVSTDALLEAYAAGLQNYRERRWDEACENFRRALAVRSNDHPSEVFLERSEHYRTQPPGDDWSGVWVMTQK